jgi:DNA-binding NarL/FixJ family response regulator
MEPYRIILADDHVLIRQGLKRILEKAPGIEIIGEAGDGIALLRLFNKLTPNLVLLDISMPNLRGLEAIREIKATHPTVKVLMLTMHKEIEYFHQAVSAGADGYLLKEDADSELFSAIEKIQHGKIYISPVLSDELTDEWAQMRRGDYKPFSKPKRLTVREREVLKLIAESKSSKQIADLLFISPRTVEHHRANLMEKLGLKKTADLVKYAIQKGYI